MFYALYNAREVAEALGVTERTVRRWITAGQLPAIKAGRAFQIRIEDARAVVARSGGVRRARAETQLAELRGQYRELQAHARRLERMLADEQRRAGHLEERLKRVA
jgi:excisionase family DNA binding protein